MDRPPDAAPRATPRRSLRVTLIVLVLLALCVIAVLTIVGPMFGNVFKNPIIYPECSFSATVVAFFDADADQIQDVGEAGMANVRVSFTVNSQAGALVKMTDADGAAQIGLYEGSCTSPTIYVVVDTPPGRMVTTASTFGPYEPNFMPPHRLLYVGFR